MELPSTGSFEYLKDVPSKELDVYLEEIIGDIVDDIILGECFDIHRYFKLKIFPLNLDEKEVVEYYIDHKSGSDISGHQLSKEKLKNITTTCKLCKNTVTAVLFVRHLQDHYSKNRASSRIALQRIKNAANDESDLVDHDDEASNSSSQKSSRKRHDNGGNRNKGKVKALK